MEKYTPTEFISFVNQTLEYSYSEIMIEGEVASFKVNQNKWVFFDLKDENSSISCFMAVWDLRMPLEDGMKVIVRGTPKVTKVGRFSFTVRAIRPVGEGSLKKAYEILKKKLTEEGLFNPEKKRMLPEGLTKLGVISSTQAAGYADFIKILNARWGGIKIQVAHTQVQGLDAPDQIIRALEYFNEQSEVQVIAILRGGGSADDLACFNDEKLVRAIAASRIPVITGIGHEIDETLCDLAADVRASTPSNAAELLTKDRKNEKTRIVNELEGVARFIKREITTIEQTKNEQMFNVTDKLKEKVQLARQDNLERMIKISDVLKMKYIEPTLMDCENKIKQVLRKIQDESRNYQNSLQQKLKLLEILNPEKVLAQGYAILSGKISPGEEIKITLSKKELIAEIKEIHERRENELK